MLFAKYLPHLYQGAESTGRRVLNLGGGPEPAPQPTSTTTTTTTIPEYAQPYMERLLGKAEAASNAPYQTYGGERLAPESALEQQARASVASMQVPGQFEAGTGLTAAGGLSSLGAGQQYYQMATSPGMTQAFMSPYTQGVVDVQKQEAIRDAQQGQLAANLGAARQGTYGGARQLLASTERERNLQQNLANIQATGLQSAYEQAQKAQQFGATLGLQGAGQALQAGQTLGQLGTQQQATAQNIANLQQQFGQGQQQQQQAALDLAYQDFLAQQRYPYTQLGFMSDILRGSGNLAQTGGTAVYSAQPTMTQQLLGLGGAALGQYLKAKTGGHLKKDPNTGLMGLALNKLES